MEKEICCASLFINSICLAIGILMRNEASITIHAFSVLIGLGLLYSLSKEGEQLCANIAISHQTM